MPGHDDNIEIRMIEKLRILITGFGPFPGAPFNPTMPLVKRLTQLRRPAFADVELIGHIFHVAYATVEAAPTGQPFHVVTDYPSEAAISPQTVRVELVHVATVWYALERPFVGSV